MRAALLVALSLACAAAAAQQQVPLQLKKKRELKGRFLHITDIHPDPNYKPGATVESACHDPPDKGKKDKGKKLRWSRYKSEDDDDGRGESSDATASSSVSPTRSSDDDDEDDRIAGPWGTKLAICDAPPVLVDHTLDFLKKEFAGEIDFVIWTGDNVRHDRDRNLPRTPKEIFDANRAMATRMRDVFGPDIPIIPNLGNNDVWPHNILQAGPNRVLSEYMRIWKKFIPEDDRHVFERGGYFVVEAIPNRLAVISLNTLFWFESNSAVDGCPHNSKDPGSVQFDWLEVQLEMFRDRGMQVYLMGHIPPHMMLYYDPCYLRFGDLALRFQDTIVGHLFGHMNIDHFFLMSVDELEKVDISRKPIKSDFVNGTALPHGWDDFEYPGPYGPLRADQVSALGDISIMGSKEALKKKLTDTFGDIPDAGSTKNKDYAVMNVGPSIIPTYIPSFRVFSYNISGVTLDDDPFLRDPLQVQDEDEDDFEDDSSDDAVDALKKKNKNSCSRDENIDRPHCSFKKRPRHSSPESPSRSNKPLTPLGYSVFYLKDIDNEKHFPPWEVEYTTFGSNDLLPEKLSGVKRSQPPPIPYHLLPGYSPELGKLTPEELASLATDTDVERDPAANKGKGKKGKGGKGGKGGKDKDKDPKERFLDEIRRITPWKLNDLTVNSYVKFARRLGTDQKMWRKFVEYMFVSSGAYAEDSIHSRSESD